MYRLFLTAVTPVPPEQVSARLAAEAADTPDLDQPLFHGTEPVRASVCASDKALARQLFERWTKRPEVRAGRARVRIVEAPDQTPTHAEPPLDFGDWACDPSI